jgi:predicted Zn-dependent protease
MTRWIFTALASTLLLTAPAMAQNKALGALGQLLGGQVPTVNPLAALLPATAPAPSTPAAGDLMALLSQPDSAVDESREIEIGRQLAAVLLGSKPLHTDMALQRYVNQLGRWISLHSSRPALPWSFAILDDAGFNAFAAPGGYVFVTKGLLDRVDEAELAGILAHEIVHVTERHHLHALRAKARAGAATRLLASQVRAPNAVAGALSSQLLALGRDLYSSGLDQGDEFDADRQGVVLAARAGFDPYGLAAVLQQLRAEVPDNPLFALSLATHPPAQQRLDLLDQSMGRRLDLLAGKPSVPITRRIARRN